MKLHRMFKAPIALVVAASFVSATTAVASTLPSLSNPLTPASNFEFSAEAVLGSHGDLRGKITQELQNEKFVKQLGQLGIAKEEVELRLAGMTDNELQQVSHNVQRQAGGEVITIGLTTLLLIIIIILLLR